MTCRNSGLYTTILTALIDLDFEATCILCGKGSSPSGTHYEKDFIPLDNAHLTLSYLPFFYFSHDPL